MSNMLSGIIERKMEIEPGEHRFTRQEREAFFGAVNLGSVDHVHRVRFVQEGSFFRVNLDVTRTNTFTKGQRDVTFATGRVKGYREAVELQRRIDTPASINRANRVLSGLPLARKAAGAVALTGAVVAATAVEAANVIF